LQPQKKKQCLLIVKHPEPPAQILVIEIPFRKSHAQKNAVNKYSFSKSPNVILNELNTVVPIYTAGDRG
jgi:hypothetical protein